MVAFRERERDRERERETERERERQRERERERETTDRQTDKEIRGGPQGNKTVRHKPMSSLIVFYLSLSLRLLIVMSMCSTCKWCDSSLE